MSWLSVWQSETTEHFQRGSVSRSSRQDLLQYLFPLTDETHRHEVSFGTTHASSSTGLVTLGCDRDVYVSYRETQGKRSSEDHDESTCVGCCAGLGFGAAFATSAPRRALLKHIIRICPCVYNKYTGMAMTEVRDFIGFVRGREHCASVILPWACLDVKVSHLLYEMVCLWS
jgi:hypothetical protein